MKRGRLENLQIATSPITVSTSFWNHFIPSHTDPNFAAAAGKVLKRPLSRKTPISQFFQIFSKVFDPLETYVNRWFKFWTCLSIWYFLLPTKKAIFWPSWLRIKFPCAHQNAHFAFYLTCTIRFLRLILLEQVFLFPSHNQNWEQTTNFPALFQKANWVWPPAHSRWEDLSIGTSEIIYSTEEKRSKIVQILFNRP